MKGSASQLIEQGTIHIPVKCMPYICCYVMLDKRVSFMNKCKYYWQYYWSSQFDSLDELKGLPQQWVEGLPGPLPLGCDRRDGKCRQTLPQRGRNSSLHQHPARITLPIRMNMPLNVSWALSSLVALSHSVTLHFLMPSGFSSHPTCPLIFFRWGFKPSLSQQSQTNILWVLSHLQILIRVSPRGWLTNTI